MAPRILLRHSILEYDWKRLTSVKVLGTFTFKGTTVEAKRVDKELYGDADAYEIKLMDGNYIYEVHAYFSESDSGSGDAYYGFYTAKFPN